MGHRPNQKNMCSDTIPPVNSKCPEPEEDQVKLYTMKEMISFAEDMYTTFASGGSIVLNAHDVEAWARNQAVGIEINKSDLERVIQLLVSLENAK